jgi:hypothetical protein
MDDESLSNLLLVSRLLRISIVLSGGLSNSYIFLKPSLVT